MPAIPPSRHPAIPPSRRCLPSSDGNQLIFCSIPVSVATDSQRGGLSPRDGLQRPEVGRPTREAQRKPRGAGDRRAVGQAHQYRRPTVLDGVSCVIQLPAAIQRPAAIRHPLARYQVVRYQVVRYQVVRYQAVRYQVVQNLFGWSFPPTRVVPTPTCPDRR